MSERASLEIDGQTVEANIIQLYPLILLKLCSYKYGKGRLKDAADVLELIKIHRELQTEKYAEEVHEDVRAQFKELQKQALEALDYEK